jgi:hypothetical protein
MLTNYLIVGGVSFVIGFGSAWQVQDWRHDSKVLKADQKIEVRQDQNIDKAQVASTQFEAKQSETKTEFKTIYRDVGKIVYRPIYANTCFDADGLQLITKAVENTITTGKPSDFVQ